MNNSGQDLFHESLTPPQTPSPKPAKKFYLPLSTLSIYCREHGSNEASNKASRLPQDASLIKTNCSATTDKLSSLTQLPLQSSVVELSKIGHMTQVGLTYNPTTPPLTPPPSHTKLGVGCNDVRDCWESSPKASTSSLLPSSSISTSLSEPPTPTPNGSINQHRVSIAHQSKKSSPRTKSNESDTFISLEQAVLKDGGIVPQTPRTRSPPGGPKSSAGKTNRYFQSLATNQKTPKKPKKVVIKRKVPKFIPEPGPFIPEGLSLVQYPQDHSVIAPDTLEAGYITGYGRYPVQATALQIAREKRRIMRNKVRHYALDDDVKNVRSSGSVSGESETSEETERDSANRCGLVHGKEGYSVWMH